MTKNIPCTIKYNKAVEFTLSLLKYSNYKKRQTKWNVPELKKDAAKDLMDFTPNQQVKEWLAHVDKNISPFLNNDILFLTNEVYRVIDICFHLVLMEDLEEPVQLLRALEDIDTDAMIEIVYKFYELDASLENEAELRSAITEHYSPAMAAAFLEMKNYPEEFKNKAVAVLTSFYKEFYQPFEEEVYSYMDDRLVIHQKLYDKDPIYFINTVGLGDYSETIKMHKNIIMYMSYFIDVGIFYFTYEDTLAMYCGQSVEHRFKSAEDLINYQALFKALSDDRRLEIIKLTSKRPWYNRELADYFNLSTATLSYHLNLLLDLGILNFEPSIVNNRYYYTTNTKRIKELLEVALLDLVG